MEESSTLSISPSPGKEPTAVTILSPEATPASASPVALDTCLRELVSPAPASPIAVDVRLRELVKLYGGRWQFIGTHMQAIFSVVFDPGELERRWHELQQLDAAARDETFNRCSPHTRQIRRPLGEVTAPGEVQLRPSPVMCKRPRGQEAFRQQLQPSRRPPQPSPCMGQQPLTHRCPIFLLAPGSSLAAPETMRKQLKTVYLVRLLQKTHGQPSAHQQRWPMSVADEQSSSDEAKTRYGTPSEAEKAAISELLSPTQTEKGAIAELLAKELSNLSHRRMPSPSAKAPSPPRNRSAVARQSPLQQVETSDASPAAYMMKWPSSPPKLPPRSPTLLASMQR